MNLQHDMQERLSLILGHSCASLAAKIAEQLGEVTSSWLIEVSREEVFDSPGEYALRRAAEQARSRELTP